MPVYMLRRIGVRGKVYMTVAGSEEEARYNASQETVSGDKDSMVVIDTLEGIKDATEDAEDQTITRVL